MPSLISDVLGKGTKFRKRKLQPVSFLKDSERLTARNCASRERLIVLGMTLFNLIFLVCESGCCLFAWKSLLPQPRNPAIILALRGISIGCG